MLEEEFEETPVEELDEILEEEVGTELAEETPAVELTPALGPHPVKSNAAVKTKMNLLFFIYFYFFFLILKCYWPRVADVTAFGIVVVPTSL